MKIIVNPDIHCRNFWEESTKNVKKWDKIIFLGDYFDPYDFEKLTIKNGIENFQKIIKIKQRYDDKIILLLGNHKLFH